MPGNPQVDDDFNTETTHNVQVDNDSVTKNPCDTQVDDRFYIRTLFNARINADSDIKTC